jgi:hypothetical protein
VYNSPDQQNNKKRNKLMEECFFDATTVDPLDSGFAPIPEGDYEVAIVKSTNKPTKSGLGSYLELQCQVVSGEYAKRVLWTRLNLKNPSTAAVEMAKRELSSICHATGVLRPRCKEDLNNIAVIAHVVQVADNKGEMKNEIKGWKAKDKSAAPAQTQTQEAQSNAPTGAGEKPW